MSNGGIGVNAMRPPLPPGMQQTPSPQHLQYHPPVPSVPTPPAPTMPPQPHGMYMPNSICSIIKD